MKEEKLFVPLVIALSLGLFLALAVLYISPKDKDPFSSVQFTNPDDLPNLARVNSEQQFDYGVSSFENSTSSYNLTTTLQLYRLYDVTEGLHSCLSPYREKFFIGWSNKSTPLYVQTAPENLIQDLTMSQPQELLNWDETNLYFNLGKTRGDGDLIIYYGPYNSSPDFVIRINTLEGNIYFNETYMNKINVSRQNDRVRISVHEGLLVFVHNDDVLFQEKTSLSQGQFGFESRNALFSITRMLTSKNFPIEIPDRGNVINYDVDEEFFYNELARVKNLLEKNYDLSRRYDVRQTEGGVPRNCNSFDCTYTQTTRQSLTLQNINSTKSYVKNLPWGGTTFPYEHVGSDPVYIPWHYFNITATKPEFENTSSVSFLFGDKLALIWTNKSISTAYLENETLHVKQYPYNGSTFLAYVNNQSVSIETQDGLRTIELPYDMYNETIELFTIDLSETVEQVHLGKTGCEPLTFCSITLRPTTPRSASPRTDETFGFGELITVPLPPNYRYPSQEEQTPEDEITTQPIIDQNRIPSTKAAFNGDQAIIWNSTNFSLSLRAQYLDGDGILSVYFSDLNNSVLFNLTHNILKNTVTFNDDELFEYNNPLAPRQLEIKYRENITIYYNRTAIYTTKSYGNLTGYFTIETDNTHLELSNLYLQNQVATQRLPLLEDPCRLRLIYSETLRDESFSLEPQTSKTFTDNFELDRFFDYGKVNVDLYGSSQMNGTPLHIHYWLVRE